VAPNIHHRMADDKRHACHNSRSTVDLRQKVLRDLMP
jgi:hypothetical protein